MSRPVTPATGAGSRAASYLGGDNTTSAAQTDHNHIQSGPHDSSYISGGLQDDSSVKDGTAGLERSNSQISQTGHHVPLRGNTLKKKASMNRGSSLKRSGSKKSNYAGSVKSLRAGEKEKYESEEYNSAFYCPIPTTGSPTDLLANRFQAWRKVLKDLVTYFRDLHKSYDSRSKSLLSAANIISNTDMPADFLRTGGIGDAASILRDFHKQAVSEANKSRDLENEVIMQLTGLRSDLSQKIKEIKSLSGDFKNSVGKEQEQTKKAVNAFQDALSLVDRDASATAARGDPFLQKLAVDRQLDRQVEEENYLHRAYLNLEASGRELESIVIGEIQKAYTVLAGILKREADENYDAAEKLREGPLAMTKDTEWDAFVTDNEYMVSPQQPLRQVQHITYPGKDHPAAIDVRSGMLERKSKYLKNYTPGWYVLSPTHLHEFKSADRIAFQQPIMSLYLPDQKIGSSSEAGSSSHKFILKGRQTGSMHRGHTWIFRAETHDTMQAWYSDIKELTERKGEARNEFVRRTHARSVSAGSHRAPSVSSGASQLEEDEADQVAFSSEQSVRGLPLGGHDPEHAGVAAGTGLAVGAAAGAMADDSRSEAGWRPPQQRPQPGGRFPSEVNVTRGLQAPLSPSSGDSSDEQDRDALAQAGALPGSGVPFVGGLSTQPHTDLQQTTAATHEPYRTGVADATSVPAQQSLPPSTSYTAGDHANVIPHATGAEVANDTQSQYREWVGTMAAGAGGAAVGAGAVSAYQQHHKHDQAGLAAENSEKQMTGDHAAIPAEGYSSAPIMASTAAPANAPSAPRAMVDSGDSVMMATGSSAYHATTMPSNTMSTSEQASRSMDGNLISGTDIRSPTQSSTVVPGTDIRTSAGTGSVDPMVAATAVGAVPAAHYSSAGSNEASAPSLSTIATTLPGASYGSSDATAGVSSPERPIPHSAKSVMTISDLHIPGEFPKTDSRGNLKSP